MRKRCRPNGKLCWLLALVTYLCLVSLVVQWMFKDYCSVGDTVDIISTPKPIIDLPRPSADEETESWMMAVRIDWHSHGFDVQPSNRSGKPKQVTRPRTDVHRTGRHVGDTRPKRCGNMTYLRDLPRVSLVMTFTSENISTLLWSLHSLQQGTPGILVADTILVHMPSPSQTDDSLRGVEGSIKSQYPEVIFLRSDPDEGLRGARMKGVQNAQGDVIVFLQMPFEVNVNWLPPLLDPLVEDKDAVTCPLIDSIGTKTRQAAKIQNGERKGFNWRFQPVNFGRSQADKSVLELPYTSPLLEEKAFAIHKTHYLEIEASILSPQWRGVDIELSLKTWLCGGKILNVPCSRIGSFSKPPRGSVTDHDAQNYRIIAHQWFEDYGKFVLSEIGRGETLSPETEDSMLDIWESLTCKPFRWFLEKVMPELLKQFPPYIPAPKLGVIQNNVCRKCVSVPFAHQDTTLIMLQSCKNSETALNYHVHLLNDGHIRLSDGKQCLSLTDFGGVVYSPCSDLERQQIWLYNSDTQTLMNEHTERCLEATVRCDRAYFPSCKQVRPKPKKSRTWLIAKDQSQLKPELNKTEIDEMKQKRKRQIHLA